MPSRRSHTNSHHGCSQCKAKKVKCDEAKPVCGRCTRSKNACKYNHLLSQSSRNETKQLHLVSLPQTSFVPCSESPLGFFDPETPRSIQSLSPPTPLGVRRASDEALYHQYINITSRSLFETSCFKSFERWDQSIREQSNTHDFVRHGMLSFAAIHLSTLQSQQDTKELYTTIALKYQNTALAKFRTAVANLSAQNCEAALGYSGILIMNEFSMHVALARENSAPVGSIADLQKLIKLFHGTASLYRLAWANSMDTNLTPYVRAELINGQKQDITVPEAEAALSLLKTCQILMIYDEQVRELYTDVVEKIRKTLRRRATQPGIANPAFMWPGMISSAYMNRVENRDPIALVMLAYWGVCLHDLDTQWWARDWGQSTVKLISESVGPEFQQYLDWPRAQVGLPRVTLHFVADRMVVPEFRS
ncbi:fungal specific transcription factor-like protein [Phlyctema vagabunda]|uniref:Fungal specific transcription factor-like protein n=1 Tax=Phlyctema vagabunda TaxID=108571 RepID=A0ABR4P5F7_9HELO